MKKETFEDAIPKPSNIYFKLWKAKHEIGKINKSADNPFFKSKYADLNTILDVIEPVLHKYNLILLQPVIDNKVYSQIVDCESGDVIESWIDLPTINDPQKLGGCISYFRRYSLQSLLSLSMQDDDANDVTQHVKQQKPKLPQANFEKGLTQIEEGKLSVEDFKAKCLGFELTEVQTAALKLL